MTKPKNPLVVARRRSGKLENRAEEVIAMYIARGMTQNEIADAVGATQRAVHLFMRRHAVPQRPQIKRDQHGEKNDSWRGEQVKYKPAHNRVYAARGKPQRCDECGTTAPDKRYEWANISGAHYDPNDYRRLCRSCHCKADGLIKNLGAYAKSPALHRR